MSGIANSRRGIENALLVNNTFPGADAVFINKLAARRLCTCADLALIRLRRSR